jgi:Kef-type K+ transport system membrane component KefB
LSASLVLLLLIPVKLVLFYWLFTRFLLRASTASRISLVLANYSEFGLIVAAIAVSIGWLPTEWMLVDAVTLSLSFVLASVLNTKPNRIYVSLKPLLKRFERLEWLPEDAPIDLTGSQMIVFGMGRVGTSVYDAMNQKMPGAVIGVDFDHEVVMEHQELGRNVIGGNATNPEFWDRVIMSPEIQYVLLVMPEHSAQVAAIDQIRNHGFRGKIAATAKYPDELKKLHALGVDAAFNIYAEVGTGFASMASAKFDL